MKQKHFHDRTALKKSSKALKVDEPVRVYKDDQWKPATITKELPHRSYIITTPDGASYRSTRSHLRESPPHPPRQYKDWYDEEFTATLQKVQEPALVPEQPPPTASAAKNSLPTKPPTTSTKSGECTTRSGRNVKPTSRLIKEI